MARTQTLVQLNDDLLGLLDARAAEEGVSRSHLVRAAITAYLSDEREKANSQRLVEGYRRQPQLSAAIDEWGDLEAFSEAGRAETFARLDAEERAGGHPPWRR